MIDMTTNAPDGPAILAERLATSGARYVEAPLQLAVRTGGRGHCWRDSGL